MLLGLLGREDLPLRELVQLGLVAELGSRLLGHAVDYQASDGRGEQGIAGGDRLDRRDQLLGPGSLEQEPGGAGAQRAANVVVLLAGG